VSFAVFELNRPQNRNFSNFGTYSFSEVAGAFRNSVEVDSKSGARKFKLIVGTAIKLSTCVFPILFGDGADSKVTHR
jgi:hypothetical protein